MTALAIVFLVLAIVIVWGGLVASIIFLQKRPEALDLPVGGGDDERSDDAAPIVHDT